MEGEILKVKTGGKKGESKKSRKGVAMDGWTTGESV